jgi:hypothetical protein
MKIVKERRKDGDIIAGFVVVALAVAAWRGASGSPALAVVMGLLAVGTIAGWAYWRRRPPSELTIGADAITWGSPVKVVTRIDHTAGDTLEFRQNAAQQTGWFLRHADAPEAGGISMIGFDMDEVGRACAEQGWRFR